MIFLGGQGIFGRARFVDGQMPKYDRPYLIVGVSTEHINVLNVSSIRGKERKLAFPTNERLRVFKPPFPKPSFVKLDSLIQIPKAEWNNFRLLDGGKTLDQGELKRIKAKL